MYMYIYIYIYKGWRRAVDMLGADILRCEVAEGRLKQQIYKHPH